jgi:hypothetical protein
MPLKKQNSKLLVVYSLKNLKIKQKNKITINTEKIVIMIMTMINFEIFTSTLSIIQLFLINYIKLFFREYCFDLLFILSKFIMHLFKLFNKIHRLNLFYFIKFLN